MKVWQFKILFTVKVALAIWRKLNEIPLNYGDSVRISFDLKEEVE